MSFKPMQITFKKAEAEWRVYHSTQQQKALLRQSIISLYNEEPDENIGGHEAFTPSSPTVNIATRLSTNKQLHYLEEVTNAIE